MVRNAAALLVLAILGTAGWSVWCQLDLPVHTVRVEGALSAAEQEAIRQVLSENLDRGLLSLDLDVLAARVRGLSWPRTVRVRRLWPDGLAIHVDKESVVAAWGEGGYLNSAGKVVRLADGVGDVPALAAELSPPRRAMEVYQLLESKVKRCGLSIARLEENELGEWLVTFDGGLTVALGNEALAARLDRFLLTYRQALEPRRQEVAHVDARYDNGVAVRWVDTGTEYALR